MSVVLMLALPRSGRAGTFLRHAAVGGVRFIIRVARVIAMLVIALAVAGMRMSIAFAVGVLAVVLVVGQLADFMPFAGPKENQGSGCREGGRVSKNRAHRGDTWHRL